MGWHLVQGVPLDSLKIPCEILMGPLKANTKSMNEYVKAVECDFWKHAILYNAIPGISCLLHTVLTWKPEEIENEKNCGKYLEIIKQFNH